MTSSVHNLSLRCQEHDDGRCESVRTGMCPEGRWWLYEFSCGCEVRQGNAPITTTTANQWARWSNEHGLPASAAFWRASSAARSA